VLCICAGDVLISASLFLSLSFRLTSFQDDRRKNAIVVTNPAILHSGALSSNHLSPAVSLSHFTGLVDYGASDSEGDEEVRIRNILVSLSLFLQCVTSASFSKGKAEDQDRASHEENCRPRQGS
jgi:hypothetical protein